jgi:hypothetical protein
MSAFRIKAPGFFNRTVPNLLEELGSRQKLLFRLDFSSPSMSQGAPHTPPSAFGLPVVQPQFITVPRATPVHTWMQVHARSGTDMWLTENFYGCNVFYSVRVVKVCEHLCV